MGKAVGSYEHVLRSEGVTVELWRVEDFAGHVREGAPQGAVCGCAIVEPEIDYLVFEAEQHDSEVGMIPAWAEGERHALVLAKLLDVSVLDSRIPGCFWLRDYPKGAPEALVEKLRGRG